ncbi:MAG: helix-turn-helix domain-containing protein, partial [Nitrospirota bacterium]
WPGNVRELEHALEHAVILARSEVLTLEDLPQDLGPATGPGRKDCSDAIARALKETGGNKAKAARTLGISRRTLYRKLQSLALQGVVL